MLFCYEYLQEVIDKAKSAHCPFFKIKFSNLFEESLLQLCKF